MEISQTKTIAQEQKALSPSPNTAKPLKDIIPMRGDQKTVTVNCEKHGKQEAKIFFFTEWSQARCPECEREVQEERERKEVEREKAKKALQRQTAIESRLKRSGIPSRFQNHSLDSFIPPNPSAQKVLDDCREYAKKFPEMKKLGRCMIFTGTTGTGKTHLSCGVANFIIREHMASALFISALNAVRTVKETYSRTSEKTERDALAFFQTPDLLILDEIGVQFGSDAEKLIIFEVINNRYENMLPTFLLSNLAANRLSDYVGERIMDRMKENGGRLHAFQWPSHRGS